MTKTGIKTFVCSFVLSLFVIFSINGVFLRESLSRKNDLKIPHQNITLFLKKEKAVLPNKTAEIKKIALTLPAKTPPTQLEATSPVMVEEDKNPPVKQPAVIQKKKKAIPQSGEKPSIVLAQAEIIPLETPQKTEKLINADEQIMKKPAAAALLPIVPPPPNKPKEIQLAAVDKKKTQNNILNTPRRPEPLIPLEKGSVSTADLKKEVQIAGELPTKPHIALSDAKIPIAGMKTEKKDEDNAWVPMKEKKAADGNEETPWTTAKAAKQPVNQLLKQEKFFNEAKAENDKLKKTTQPDDPIKSHKHLTNDYEIQLASKTVDNIIIPIPKDILEDENLTPRLVSSPDEQSKEKEAQLEAKFKEKNAEENEKPQETTSINTEKDSIFDSLNSIFSSADSNVRPPEIEPKEDNALAEKLKSWKKKLAGKKAQKILPVEMRLSFQPNRAEISGQTLRWIKAFANKAKGDKTTAIEIRIDGTNYQDLQQKRLSLLHSILLHDGVEQGKINTVFTDREPNSFIIRTIKLRNNNAGKVNGAVINNRPLQQQGYYLQW